MKMEYDIPEELAVFIDKMEASEDLRDRCLKSPFGFRRARKSAADIYYFKRKFWTGFFELYPEEEGKYDLSYIKSIQKVVRKQ